MKGLALCKRLGLGLALILLLATVAPAADLTATDTATMNAAVLTAMADAVAGVSDVITVNTNGPIAGATVMPATGTAIETAASVTIQAGTGFRPVFNDKFFTLGTGNTVLIVNGCDIRFSNLASAAYGMIPTCGGSMTFNDCNLENTAADGTIIDSINTQYWPTFANASDTHVLTLNRTTLKASNCLWMGMLGKVVATDCSFEGTNAADVPIKMTGHVAAWATQDVTLNRCMVKGAGGLVLYPYYTAVQGMPMAPFKATNCVFIPGTTPDNTGAMKLCDCGMDFNFCTFKAGDGVTHLSLGYIYSEAGNSAAATANPVYNWKFNNNLFDFATSSGKLTVPIRYSVYSTRPQPAITGNANLYNTRGTNYCLNAWYASKTGGAGSTGEVAFETTGGGVRYTADGTTAISDATGRLSNATAAAPALNAGKQTATVVTVDIDGHKRPAPFNGGVDIGASEEQTVVPVELSTFAAE
jgi:hypothetical protein